MDKSVSLVKTMLPSLVKQLSDLFEVDVTIKLFGEKVFSFTWPPKEPSKVNKNEKI